MKDSNSRNTMQIQPEEAITALANCLIVLIDILQRHRPNGDRGDYERRLRDVRERLMEISLAIIKD